MENAEENNARLHDSCMCDPVPKIKFIRARDRGCPVGNDAILPRLEKANARGFDETLAGRPFCQGGMLTDFARLRYGQDVQFVTFSKGPGRTAILQKTGESSGLSTTDFLTAGLSGMRICEERCEALESGLFGRETLNRLSQSFPNES